MLIALRLIGLFKKTFKFLIYFSFSIGGLLELSDLALIGTGFFICSDLNSVLDNEYVSRTKTNNA